MMLCKTEKSKWQFLQQRSTKSTEHCNERYCGWVDVRGACWSERQWKRLLHRCVAHRLVQNIFWVSLVLSLSFLPSKKGVSIKEKTKKEKEEKHLNYYRETIRVSQPNGRNNWGNGWGSNHQKAMASSRRRRILSLGVITKSIWVEGKKNRPKRHDRVGKMGTWEQRRQAAERLL